MSDREDRSRVILDHGQSPVCDEEARDLLAQVSEERPLASEDDRPVRALRDQGLLDESAELVAGKQGFMRSLRAACGLGEQLDVLRALKHERAYISAFCAGFGTVAHSKRTDDSIVPELFSCQVIWNVVLFSCRKDNRAHAARLWVRKVRTPASRKAVQQVAGNACRGNPRGANSDDAAQAE
jgi:hypothetical protein